MAACPRFLGALGFDGFASGTDGIGLYGSTLVTLDYNDDDDFVRLAYYAIPADTATPFLEPDTLHYTASQDGAAVLGQIAVRSNGDVFYYDTDTFDLYKQNGASYALLESDFEFSRGLVWNPYDDFLYDIDRPTFPSSKLRRIDPDTGSNSYLNGGAEFPGDGILSDHPSFTPDGAIWFYCDGHPARYDLGADDFEIFTDIVPRDTSGAPVPAFGTPGAALGDVFSELLSPNDAIRISADGSYTTDVSCEPFATETGNETARVASTETGSTYLTVFLWPTTSGSGQDVWLIEGRRSRWTVGSVGWS